MLSAALLVDLLTSSYWSLNDCVRWVDKKILLEPEPDVWLLEVSSCSSKNEIIGVLYRELEKNNYSDELNHKTICLGLLYAKWKKGGLSLQEFLISSWQETEAAEDIGDVKNDDISVVYDIAELEGFSESEYLLKKVNSLFLKSYQVASGEMKSIGVEV